MSNIEKKLNTQIQSNATGLLKTIVNKIFHKYWAMSPA